MTPCYLGKLEVKNRFVRGALWEGSADETGHLTEELTNIYEELARGGVGTIITGYAHVCEEEKPTFGMMGIYNDSFIPEYKEFTEKIHHHGTKIILQIVYGGFMTSYDVEKRLIWGPSSLENEVSGVKATGMSVEDIKYLVKAFASASRRAKESGFDGIQIHSAHGYMLSQFISPYYSKRTDEYGGSMENRSRLIVEIYQAIRSEVGEDFLVTIKMNSTDGLDEGGLTENDALYLGKTLSQLGIDAIEVSGGNGAIKSLDGKNKGAARTKIYGDKSKESYFKDFASKLAEEVDCSVILIGGNRTLEVMEDLMETTDIDFFSLARPLTAEPNLINLWDKNREHKAKCVSCNACFMQEARRCVLNSH